MLAPVRNARPFVFSCSVREASLCSLAELVASARYSTTSYTTQAGIPPHCYRPGSEYIGSHGPSKFLCRGTASSARSPKGLDCPCIQDSTQRRQASRNRLAGHTGQEGFRDFRGGLGNVSPIRADQGSTCHKGNKTRRSRIFCKVPFMACIDMLPSLCGRAPETMEMQPVSQLSFRLLETRNAGAEDENLPNGKGLDRSLPERWTQVFRLPVTR